MTRRRRGCEFIRTRRILKSRKSSLLFDSTPGVSATYPRKAMQTRILRRSTIAIAVAGAFAIGALTADRVAFHHADAAVSQAPTPVAAAPGARRSLRWWRSRLQWPGRAIRPRGRQHQRHRRRPQAGLERSGRRYPVSTSCRRRCATRRFPQPAADAAFDAHGVGSDSSSVATGSF